MGGTLAGLIRTQSSGMTIENSFSLEDLATRLQQNQPIFIEPTQALAHLPVIILNSQESNKWLQGQTVPIVQEQLPETIERINQTNSQHLESLNQIYYRTHNQENNQFLGISIIHHNQNLTLAKPKIVCINC